LRIETYLCAAVGVLVVSLGTLAAGCGSGPTGGIRIGVLSECEGGFQSYDEMIAGTELPLLQRGAKLRGSKPSDGVKDARVAGKPVELLLGCERFGSRASSVAELRRLVEQERADIVVGPSYAQAGPVIREYAKRHPGVTFVYGAFDQSTTLRNPAPNVFRFRVNMTQWPAGLGTYAYRELGWRNAVTIGENDFAGWDSVAGFVAEFCSLGGNIVGRRWVPGDITNYRPVVAKIPDRVDGIFFPTSIYDTKGLVDAWSAKRPNLARSLVVGDVVLTENPKDRRLLGVVASNPTPWAPTRAWSTYEATLARFFPGVKASPIGALDMFDSAEPAVEALEQVQGDVSHGERRLMTALAHLRFPSPEGVRRLDSRHQAVGAMYLGKMARNSNGKLGVNQIRVVPNVEQTFGGYLSGTTPAPSPTQPVCKRGHVPSWAR
jgi:branched-chain amino acid transport system substrate-binding protein